MKILFISNGYPPRQWAGTETYTAGIAQGLRAQGHAVQVLCGGDWDTGDRYWNGVVDEEHDGVAVRRINMNWMKAPDPNRYLYNDPESASYLSLYLDALRPDIVHVTSCERLSASVLGVVKEAGLPLVLSLTDFWFLCPRMSLLHSDGHNCDGRTTAWDCLQCQTKQSRAYRLSRRLFPDHAASQVMSCASRTTSLSKRRGFRGMALDMEDRKAFLLRAIQLPDRRLTASRFVRNMHVSNNVDVPIDVQPYGHDLAWLNGYPGKKPSQTVRFGFVGQILRSKGVHLLLEATQLAYETLGNWFTVKIYGNLGKDAQYGDHLQVLASELPNVEFCGTYAHEQSGAVFADMDLLVVPSIWYDFPLIIHEAFAAQTPVIASDLGGMAEAVSHEVDGLLFAPGDVEDLAGQMIQIVERRELVDHLRNGIGPVRTVAEQALELEAMYREL